MTKHDPRIYSPDQLRKTAFDAHCCMPVPDNSLLLRHSSLLAPVIQYMTSADYLQRQGRCCLKLKPLLFNLAMAVTGNGRAVDAHPQIENRKLWRIFSPC